ncbi:hypothetical protein [Actinomadura sp. WMMA1423]|uniref:hypothetical protein n=1 Tax=Actinomadura sp. WMMA1423 TaxID=2591108 RepID=UPI00114782B2|nr:hypothetical protein [Actinomadura sp. WMMA1423]
MTIPSSPSNENNQTDQVTDDVLDEYWAMHLRAQEQQDKFHMEALPLQQDHQQRTANLAELHRRREAIERDISAQEAMIRTVAANIGTLNSQAEQARRKAELHASNVARLVEDTGRPHPKTRWEKAAQREAARREEENRRVIAQQLQPPYPAEGQVPTSPMGAVPPPLEEPPADSTPSRGLARLRGARAGSNGSTP